MPNERKGKTQVKELPGLPLTVLLSKNGRPVSKTVAKTFLAQRYPACPGEWLLVRNDHSLRATYVHSF